VSDGINNIIYDVCIDVMLDYDVKFDCRRHFNYVSNTAQSVYRNILRQLTYLYYVNGIV
jgi:hypothetical protein